MVLNRRSTSRSGSTFFGLTPEYRLSFYSQIHEIVFHGNGGYSWSDVYNMPIWLRRFTFQKLKEHYDKQNEQNKNIYENKKQSQQISKGPNIKPSYSTKASK